jgi:hypothetical protein
VNEGKRKGQRADTPRSSVATFTLPLTRIAALVCQFLVCLRVIGGLGMLLLLLFLRPLLDYRVVVLV